MIKIFKQFDKDGSRRLVAGELAKLNNDSDVMVDRAQIGKIFGNKKVIFSQKSFEQMMKDKLELNRFKSEMKRLVKKLK